MYLMNVLSVEFDACTLTRYAQGGHLRTITSSATSLEPVRTYGRSIYTSAAIMVKLPAAIMASHRAKMRDRDIRPLGGEGFWEGDYGGGVRVGRHFGARWLVP